MDLNTLELFTAIAETSSFSLAAKKLGLPRSTVSRGLARLEGELGVTLVNRTTRQVSLSSAGVAMLERIGPQLAALKRALGDLPETEEEPRGHLRITAAVDFGATFLPELLSHFMTRYPQVTLEVNLSNRLVDLVAERYDVAFRASQDRLKDSALMARKVSSMAMQLFASPTYLARRGTPRTPRELAGHEWVLFRKLGSMKLQGPGETATVEMKGRLFADDLFFVREAARAGGGVAALPSFLSERDVETGELVRLLPRWDASAGMLWVVTPGGAHLPKKTAALRDFALDWLRTHPLMPIVA